MRGEAYLTVSARRLFLERLGAVHGRLGLVSQLFERAPGEEGEDAL
jgi:hypothetical protein